MLLGSHHLAHRPLCPSSRQHSLVNTRIAASSGASSSSYGSSSGASSSGRSPRFDSPGTSSSSGSQNGYYREPGSGVRGGGPSAPRKPLSQAEMNNRMAQLNELISEAGRIVISSGPKGLLRGMQAATAFISLAQEYTAKGLTDPPQVILRKLFEKLGATYIKLGQFIASSPSIFPDEYVLEFQKCLDKTDPVPYSVIKATIERELGRPSSEVFSYIDPTPLASASVAQVHSAVLAASNKEVVLKVLKPETEDTLSVDLDFVYLVTRFIEFLQPDLARLSIGGIVGDIRASMADEVDFRKEATYLAQFSSFLDAQQLRGIATCPYVYKQHSSQRLLVMERLKGVPLVDYNAIRSITTKDPEQVLIGALNTWFASVLSCETFHADVHAGNLLVLPDGRVAFIDFGIVGKISPVTWQAMQSLITSVATGDYEIMARALATIGACDDNVDFQAFARDLEAFFTELEQVNTSLVVTPSRNPNGAPGVQAAVEVDQTQVNRLFINVVRIGEAHSVRFPREFGMFIKQLLYFDRYTRILAPSLQVFNDDRIRIRDLSGSYGRR